MQSDRDDGQPEGGRGGEHRDGVLPGVGGGRVLPPLLAHVVEGGDQGAGVGDRGAQLTADVHQNSFVGLKRLFNYTT